MKKNGRMGRIPPSAVDSAAEIEPVRLRTAERNGYPRLDLEREINGARGGGNEEREKKNRRDEPTCRDSFHGVLPGLAGPRNTGRSNFACPQKTESIGRAEHGGSFFFAATFPLGAQCAEQAGARNRAAPHPPVRKSFLWK